MSSSGEEEEDKDFITQLPPISGWGSEVGTEWASAAEHIIGADQKIPEWFIRITFLETVKTTVKSGIKSRFGIGFNSSDISLALLFFLLTPTLSRIDKGEHKF